MATCALDPSISWRASLKVETDRGIDFFHDGAGATRETAAPHFVAHLLALFKRSQQADGPMTQPHSQRNHAPRPSRIIAFAIGALAVLVLGFVLYGMKAPGGKEAAVDPACFATAQTAARLQPLVHGEVAALNLALEAESSAGTHIRPRRKGRKPASRISRGGRFFSTCGRHGAFLAGWKCPRSTVCRACAVPRISRWSR